MAKDHHVEPAANADEEPQLRDPLTRLLDEVYSGSERHSRDDIQRRATAADLPAAVLTRIAALPEGEYTEDEAAEALGVPES